MNAETWRLIDTGPGDAFYNMALDEALSQNTIRSEGRPTLRIYTWSTLSVTLGRFQSLSEVDSDFCSTGNIPIVRRPTGGRAILHWQHELTYSFSASTSSEQFSGGLFDSYAVLSRAFLESFRLAGLEVEATSRKKKAAVNKNPLCFSSTSFGEITVRGKKIIGSAQRRWPGGMLQQGSIPFEVPREETARTFRSQSGARDLMGISEAKPGLNYEILKQAIIKGFESSLGISFEQTLPNEEELGLAGTLEAEKYLTHKWNHLK